MKKLLFIALLAMTACMSQDSKIKNAAELILKTRKIWSDDELNRIQVVYDRYSQVDFQVWRLEKEMDWLRTVGPDPNYDKINSFKPDAKKMLYKVRAFCVKMGNDTTRDDIIWLDENLNEFKP